MKEDIGFEVYCKLSLTDNKEVGKIFDIFCDYLEELALCFGGSVNLSYMDGIISSDIEDVPATESDRELVELFLNCLEGTSSVVIKGLVDLNKTYREDLEK